MNLLEDNPKPFTPENLSPAALAHWRALGKAGYHQQANQLIMDYRQQYIEELGLKSMTATQAVRAMGGRNCGWHNNGTGTYTNPRLYQHGNTNIGVRHDVEISTGWSRPYTITRMEFLMKPIPMHILELIQKIKFLNIFDDMVVVTEYYRDAKTRHDAVLLGVLTHSTPGKKYRASQVPTYFLGQW